MGIKVIRSKDVMATEDLLNIKGGLNELVGLAALPCTCDCWINENNLKPTRYKG